MSATKKLINEIIEEVGADGPIAVLDIDVLAGYFNRVYEEAREEFLFQPKSGVETK
jgi:hypothetical protein